MISIDDALLLAVKAHKGQKDLEGNPEILHPIKVGLTGNNRAEMIAGFLHDVVEDSSYTLDDLRALGVDDNILEALQLLTHDKQAMSYDDYVDRIIASGNALAINVKYHDLCHNIERGRQHGHQRLVAKHSKARAKLLARCSHLLTKSE